MTPVVSIQKATTMEFNIILDLNFTPSVQETKYYTFWSFFLELGAFRSIIELVVAIIAGASIYKSYSTFMSRQIQRDM
jgi:hypothetical protein